ncbi:MAG: hypothetical protein JRH18_24145 [Deltaproteobacteria bacterium]|nr:hypothetical protein [Deltaproteobacteria bacterium]MBW1994901.1 hypothetical protein [Deltaproteobacteria bacterium]MBW2154740.1 hypothetical protein [Deltaproteobacteria bacterium]
MTRNICDICRADSVLLAYFAENKQFDRLKECLQNPFMADSIELFGTSEQDFCKKIASFKGHLQENFGLWSFFELHVVTHFLLFKDSAPKWVSSWIENNLDIRRILPSFRVSVLHPEPCTFQPPRGCFRRPKMVQNGRFPV